MKKLVHFLPLILALSLVSCASNGMKIPGESKIILKNLATEYYTLAEGFMEIKNYTKAAEYYKLAMRNEELYLTAYYKLARSYALAKNWEEAIKTYNELIALDGDNTMLKTSIAYITAMRGDVDDAILQYRELMVANPYDENILESLIALLINVGRGEDAEEYFFILKEKFPDNKQITTFAQQLADMVDNFDADKKVELPSPPDGEAPADEKNAADKKNPGGKTPEKKN